MKFSTTGDIGSANIVCRPSQGVDEEEGEQTSIELQEPVTLSFALRYLNSFTKARGGATHRRRGVVMGAGCAAWNGQGVGCARGGCVVVTA